MSGGVDWVSEIGIDGTICRQAWLTHQTWHNMSDVAIVSTMSLLTIATKGLYQQVIGSNVMSLEHR